MKAVKAQQYVEDAYRTYGQHVIGHRAVADYRDGLKPVQRRILWAMHEMGLEPTKNFAKSARTVGEVLGKYHPAGDVSVYDTLVGLVNAYYPLVEGEGNYGSLTDPAAAYRYTLARLSVLADLMLGSDDSVIEKTPNFDGTLQEPVCLPAAMPWLLLNGSSGIAVGIAAEVPPHNILEVIAALQYVVRAGSKADLAGVLEHIKAPDYGSAVLLSGADQIADLYRTGEGQLSYRCDYKVTQDGQDSCLTITDYAPRFNIQKFIDTCQRAVDAGNLLSVTDESSADNGTRLVVAFTNARFVRDTIVPLLDTSVSYRFYVNETTKDGPRTMRLGLLEFLQRWVAWRRSVEKALIDAERARLAEVLRRQRARVVAAANIKKIADILARGSDSIEHDIANALKVSAEDAAIIVDIPLRTLNRANVRDLEADADKTSKAIADVDRKLQNIDKVMLKNLEAIAERYSDRTRRTALQTKRPRIAVPDDKPNTWLIATHDGEVTRLEGSPVDRRGGLRYDMVVQVGAQFWVVHQTGQMLRVDTASLAVGKPRAFGKIAGVVATSVPKIAVMDEDGNGIVLEQASLGKDKYQALKTDVPVTKAVGVPDGMGLFVANNECGFIHGHDDLTCTRVNSSGWKFLPKRKKGATSLQVADKTAVIETQQGFSSYTVKTGETFELVGDVYTVPQLLIEWAEGKDICQHSDAVSQSKSRRVNKVLPVQ